MNSIICPKCLTRHPYGSPSVQYEISKLTEVPGTINITCTCGTILSMRFIYMPAIRLIATNPQIEIEEYKEETVLWNT